MLSFQDIMNFNPSNQSNYNELRDLIKNNRIAPFIGAGLTVFCYGTWKDALISLASNLASDNIKAQANDMINSCKYMEAADFICEMHGERALKRYMEAYFSPTKLEDNKAILYKQAIWLLPDLFNHLLFTTNYDQVIKSVYRVRFPEELIVEFPGNIRQLGPAIRNADVPFLYKLHGTMRGPRLKEGWVLTQQQYNNAYASDKPLSKDLKAAYSGISFLFLGCSLGQDRTMEILQESIQERPDIQHYAILSCNEQQRDETIKRFSEEKNIDLILYPDGAHQSVRIILEQLVHDLNPNSYDNLGYYEGLPNTTSIRPYDYDSGYLPFVGEERNRALSTLANEFCKKGNGFKWWAVVGPGGAGKSRIGYELSQKLKREGWYTKWLDKSDYDNLDKLNENEQISMHDTLIVADYVQAYAKEIGTWLYRQINKPRARSLRVLLIERNNQIKDQGDNKNNTKLDIISAIINSEFNKLNWLTSMKSDSAIHKPKLLDECCHLQDFLELKPFNDKDLTTLIISHIKKYNEIHPDAINVQSTAAIQPIIKRLKEIDPDYVRPLYAIILTELYLTKHDFSSMSLVEILDEVVTREERILVNAINQSFGKEHPILEENCLSLWHLATAWQDISLEDIKKYNSERWQEVTGILKNRGFKAEAFLKVIGLIKNREIAALRPDLIGEFFVLRWLMSENVESTEVVDFINNVWQKPFEAFVFFTRLCSDFLSILAKNQERMELVRYPLFDKDTTQSTMLAYAYFLAGLTYYQNKDNCFATLERINELVESYPMNEGFVLVYAYSLVNLSAKQDVVGISDTVEKLSVLANNYPENKDIAFAYALVLIILSFEQDAVDISETIEKLSTIVESHLESEAIALEYDRGLINLSVEQDVTGMSEIVEQLSTIAQSNLENEANPLEYAMGLFNLSTKQDVAVMSETVEELSTIVERYFEENVIALAYANALVNLSVKQEVAERNQTVNKLLKLAERYPENEALAMEYAKGLYNLTYEQKIAGISETVDKLSTLANRYCENEEFALVYAYSLVNLSAKQDVVGISETLDKLSVLAVRYSESEDIALAYVKGLVNLSNKQDAAGISETVDKLSVLVKRYPENEAFELVYANGLVNLSAKQDAAEISETLDKLSVLVKRYPNNEAFALEYAKGLLNLSAKQDADGTSETVDKLSTILESHLKNEAIALEYAKSLVNLSVEQDVVGRSETVGRLSALVKRYSENEAIALAYAKGLVNLSVEQDATGISETVDKLSALAECYRENESIALEYAKSLVNLSVKQDAAGISETVDKLSALVERYREN